ncbi:WxcM-like protein [Arcticibacter pallidicorallinus]|uniref:WxcM-like protein n=1 Tax=Arcticibacter pallidicorallinus TaxID=1259464 RepID=A0A2T0U6Y4_9SPHI|nr:FdtA/QdtA family cupin domain-containing protein [Arcticibacter pallidicorallinus]PRY53675.1 WxcM-like protein [Arcticibacter pallidicorallinus]
MTIEECKFIEFPKILDERGNLSFLEEKTHIPFEVRRSYWIYDVPGGEIRGGHSYKENQEIIIALSGSFDIAVNDGSSERIISLNRSYYGLYVPAGIWRHMQNFSTNSLAFIVASKIYSEEDYIREYEIFKS